MNGEAMRINARLNFNFSVVHSSPIVILLIAAIHFDRFYIGQLSHAPKRPLPFTRGCRSVGGHIEFTVHLIVNRLANP